MVSFVCETCQETIKKPKLDQHTYKCRNAQFTCVDCSTTFAGTSYRDHKSCISEKEKYERSVYKAPKAKGATPSSAARDAENNGVPKSVSKAPANIVKPPTSESLISQIKKSENKETVSEDPASASPSKNEGNDDAKKSKKDKKDKKRKSDDVQSDKASSQKSTDETETTSSPAKKSKKSDAPAEQDAISRDAEIVSAFESVLSKGSGSTLASLKKKLVKKLQKADASIEASYIESRVDALLTIALKGGSMHLTLNK
eukprot:jgi/Hompol1/6897/HPOL_005116-RA